MKAEIYLSTDDTRGGAAAREIALVLVAGRVRADKSRPLRQWLLLFDEFNIVIDLTEYPAPASIAITEAHPAAPSAFSERL